MSYGLISVVMVCTLAAAACIAAAARLLSVTDALKRAQTTVEAMLETQREKVADIGIKVSNLQLGHYDGLRSILSQHQGEIAGLQAQVISWRESFETMNAKLNAREARERKASKEAPAAEPAAADPAGTPVTLEQLVAQGVAVPLHQNGKATAQQEPARPFGRRL